VQTGSVPTFGVTGELHDGAAGLVTLRARWYTTRAGTFTAVDPFAGFAAQPYSQHPYQSFRWQTSEGANTDASAHHLYAYALNNPVLYTDPSGLSPCVDAAGRPQPCPLGSAPTPTPVLMTAPGASAPPAPPAPLGPNPPSVGPTTTPTAVPRRGRNAAQILLDDAGGVVGAGVLVGRLPGPVAVAGGICLGVLVLAAAGPVIQAPPIAITIPRPAPTPDREEEITVYRGVNATNPGAFRVDPDGVSVFETLPAGYKFAIPFRLRYTPPNNHCC
jgi:hypothetical protein